MRPWRPNDAGIDQKKLYVWMKAHGFTPTEADTMDELLKLLEERLEKNDPA